MLICRNWLLLQQKETGRGIIWNGKKCAFVYNLLLFIWILSQFSHRHNCKTSHKVFLVQINQDKKLYAAKTMARGYYRHKAMAVEKRVLSLGRLCPFITSLHCAFSTPVSESIAYLNKNVHILSVIVVFMLC